MVHNSDVQPVDSDPGAGIVMVDDYLGLGFSADDLAELMDAESAMGFVPEIGDTDFEAGASVDLDPLDRPSLFASITDEAIF